MTVQGWERLNLAGRPDSPPLLLSLEGGPVAIASHRLCPLEQRREAHGSPASRPYQTRDAERPRLPSVRHRGVCRLPTYQ